MSVRRLLPLLILLVLLISACTHRDQFPSLDSPAETHDSPDTPGASGPTATTTVIPTTPLATATLESLSTATVPAPTVTAVDVVPDSTASVVATETEPANTLVAEIDRLLSDRTGDYHVVVSGLDGTLSYDHRAGEQVQAASLYKLLIMVEVFQQVEDGLLLMEDPVELDADFFAEAGYDDPFGPETVGSTVIVDDLLRPMVMYSSNVAGYALLDLVGNWNVNATARAYGLTASEIRWMPQRSDDGAGAPLGSSAAYASFYQDAVVAADEAFNVTTANDMATLFEGLIAGEIVSPVASAEMLDILAGQVVNDRLPSLLPFRVTVAHKTGNIDNVIHDAGVVYAPQGPVVVVVLTASASEWEVVEFMGELGLMAYRHGGGQVR